MGHDLFFELKRQFRLSKDRYLPKLSILREEDPFDILTDKEKDINPVKAPAKGKKGKKGKKVEAVNKAPPEPEEEEIVESVK